MRPWVAVLGFCLIACSPIPSPVASATPSPAQSASPSVDPTVTPGATPSLQPPATPRAGPPLAKVGFACRLPVLGSSSSNGAPLRYAGAFVTFPAAASASDPTAGFGIDSSYQLTTDASPTLHGGATLSGPPAFYDRAQGRWVPASPSQSTPDGAFYAYSTWDAANPSQAKVHVVDVGKATETVFDVAVPSYAMGLTVADFGAAGVYLVANQFEQLPRDVWLMNPSTGALQHQATIAFVAAVRGGYAWGARIDPRDPSPPRLAHSGTASDSIVRVDLTTGVKTTWFYRPGLQVEFMGFDSSGAPLVQVGDTRGSSASLETWLVSSPSRPGILIHRGEPFLWNPQGDGDRIWFGGNMSDGSPAGVYLYTRAHGLQRVFGLRDSTQSFTPAGVCS